jgi:MFS family permease
MQVGLHLSASHVGTILLPAGIVLAITIAGVGRLADRQPTWLLVSVGLALLAASFALMVVVRLDSALWLLVAFAIIGRVGLGFILPSLNLGSMRPLAKPLIPQVRHRARVAAGGARRFACQPHDQPGAAGGVRRGVPDAGRALRNCHLRGVATSAAGTTRVSPK